VALFCETNKIGDFAIFFWVFSFFVASFFLQGLISTITILVIHLDLIMVSCEE